MKKLTLRDNFDIIHHEENMFDLDEPIHAEYWEANYEGLWGLGKTREEAVVNLEDAYEANFYDLVEKAERERAKITC